MLIKSIKVRNLGPIREADVEIRPFTVFLGPNNTGKSYLAYAIHSLARLELGKSKVWQGFCEDKLKEVWKRGETLVSKDDIIKLVKDNLRRRQELLEKKFYEAIFSKRYKLDDNASIEVKANLDDLKRAIESAEFSVEIPVPRSSFVLKVEKGSMGDFVVFYDGVKPRRNSRAFKNLKFRFSRSLASSIEQLSHKALLLPSERVFQYFDIFFLGLYYISENFPVRLYPYPVDEYARMMYLLSSSTKSVSEEFKCEVEYLAKHVLSGRVTIPGSDDVVFSDFEFHFSKRKKPLPIGAASSGVKGLASLQLILERILSQGDLLVIDEPEMNLHPQAQLNITNLFTMLVNKGLNILITTHSPYIVSHLDNLILAHKLSPDSKAVIEKYRIPQSALIDLSKVSIYVFGLDGRVISAVREQDGTIDESSFADISCKVQDFYNELSLLKDDTE